MNFKARAHALSTALAFVFDDERVQALEVELRDVFEKAYEAGRQAADDAATAPFQARIDRLEDEVRILRLTATADEDARRARSAYRG